MTKETKLELIVSAGKALAYIITSISLAMLFYRIGGEVAELKQAYIEKIDKVVKMNAENMELIEENSKKINKIEKCLDEY